MNKDEEFNDWLCEREDGIGYSFEKSKSDMEEDIKILETVVNYRKFDGIYSTNEVIFKSIEHLIKAYKEIEIKLDDKETELQILKDDIKADEIMYKDELLERYIPKSKIKEKIKELKEKGESDLRTYGFAIETHLAKQVLEELL